jgi:hypothetical protein
MRTIKNKCNKLSFNSLHVSGQVDTPSLLYVV